MSRLNSRRPQAISAEWEVILGSALTQNSTVQYQKRFGLPRPDFLVRTRDGTTEFLVEIVTPSDHGASKQNPVGLFFSELERLASRQGILGGLNVRVGETMIGRYPDRKRRLLLPPPRHIPRHVNDNFGEFLTQISTAPDCARAAVSQSPGVDISIVYDPKARPFNTGSYGVCEMPSSLEQNAVFRSLDEKARQLRRSGYAGLKGIMVTDGDCSALGTRGRTGGDPWSCDEIVEHFLAKHRFVDFVTTTYSETATTGGIHEKLHHKVYWQLPFDDSKITRILPVIGSALQQLPRPEKSPANAWLSLREGHDISDGCEFGACTWTPNRRLEYSARTFLEIIAGAMGRERFSLLLHSRMANKGPLFQFFRSACEQNQKLRSVRVKLNPKGDDDKIIFDLGSITAPSRATSSTAESSIEISEAVLTQFFARLAYEVLLNEPRGFSVGSLPVEVQAAVRKNLSEGRSIVAAEVVRERGCIRLSFGGPDSALSRYR